MIGVQDLEAASTLFLRHYWRRCWILQEIAFAREIHLYCGEDTIC
jgi:hypothetical protein